MIILLVAFFVLAWIFLPIHNSLPQNTFVSTENIAMEYDSLLVSKNNALSKIPVTSIQAPVGTIIMWISPTLPPGWLWCNGGSITAYPDLQTALGGSLTSPDMRGRTVVGKGTEFPTLKGETGTSRISLAENQFPLHTHPIIYRGLSSTTNNKAVLHPIPNSAYTHYSNGNCIKMDTDGSFPGWDTKGKSLATQYLPRHTSPIEGSTVVEPISILQPYIVINYIIKY